MTATRRRLKPRGPALNAPLPAINPEFRQWRLRMGLSQPAAAAALGSDESGIARYDRGEKSLANNTVLSLATQALELRPQVQAMAIWNIKALAVIHQLTDEVPVYPTLVGDTDLSDLGHNIAALEGWDLFEVDGHLEIQRDDEANTFVDDHHAMRYVRKQAKAGSVLHIWALKLHRTKLRVAA